MTELLILAISVITICAFSVYVIRQLITIAKLEAKIKALEKGMINEPEPKTNG